MHKTWIRVGDGYTITIPISDESLDLTKAVSVEIQVMKPNGKGDTWSAEDIKPHSVVHKRREDNSDIDIPGYYVLKVHALMPDNVHISWPEPDGITLEVLSDDQSKETGSTAYSKIL